MHEHEEDILNNARGNPLSSYHLEQRHKVAESLISQDTKKILDVGCGEAFFLKRLSKNPNMELYGIDISQTNLDFAKKLVPGGNFSIGDAMNLDFPDNSFDCVLFLEIIDHLPDYKKAINEAKRVLKNDGCIVMSFPDSNSPIWNTVWEIWTRTFGRQWYGKHVHELDINKFRKDLEQMGFKEIIEKRAFFGLIIIIKLKV